jgi:diaminopimelate epimerase
LESFWKCHGLGNDFVLLDRRSTGNDIDPARVRAICDRHLGVGADGVLVVLPAAAPALARMVIHNADGSRPEMCGNGLRCVVKYLAEQSPHRPTSVRVETDAGVLDSEVTWNDGRASEITIHLGVATVGNKDEAVANQRGVRVELGNPHFVLFSTALDQVSSVGPILETHSAFPNRTNVECAVPTSDGGLRVTVWERGVGITQACGTGAAAVAVAATVYGMGRYDEWVNVELPGGQVQVCVHRGLRDVELKGSSTFVYRGELV